MPSLPDPMKKFIANYQMNLVEVLEENAEYFHQEDVKLLFSYTQAFLKKDKEKVEELNNEYHIKKDVVYMIAKITDAMKLLQVAVEEEGETDMCEYIDEVWENGKKAGKKAGEKVGRKKMTKEAIINIIETLNLTVEEAMDALKISEEERKQYMELV